MPDEHVCADDRTDHRGPIFMYCSGSGILDRSSSMLYIDGDAEGRGTSFIGLLSIILGESGRGQCRAAYILNREREFRTLRDDNENATASDFSGGFIGGGAESEKRCLYISIGSGCPLTCFGFDVLSTSRWASAPSVCVLVYVYNQHIISNMLIRSIEN